MGTEFGMVCPVWDYVGDDGALLDRAAGEVGLDHVVVPLVTGEEARLRPALAPAQPYFFTEGGWHFSPSAKVYAASGLRPAKARWVGSADGLARLREHLERRGIRLVARIDLRAVRALVSSGPHLAQRNAWGQEVPTSGPCACNPNLRELLRATLEDLRRYEPAAHELTDWELDDAGSAGIRPAPGWDAALGSRLATCFCPACRQVAERAGVDPELAARQVRAGVEAAVASRPSSDLHRAADEWLTPYANARRADCDAWLRRLAHAEAPRRLRRLDAAPGLSEEGPVERMICWPTLGEVDDAEVERRLGATAQPGHGWSLAAWRPSFAAPARLVRLVSEAAQRGVPTFDFEGVTDAAPEVLKWLKQALRFARRG